MSAYRDVFLSESADYIQGIIEGLLALESDPNDLEPVEIVFRGAHTLKGMAAAMGYERTQELTHKMESLMDTVRYRRQVADHTLIDLVLRATDTVRDVIADESSGGSSVEIAEMVAALVARTESAGAEAEAQPRPIGGSAATLAECRGGRRCIGRASPSRRAACSRACGRTW